MRQLHRKLGMVAAASTLAAGGIVVSAQSASAADGWAYLVIQDRNCQNGGSVTEIHGTISTAYTYRQIWNGGDAGDNVIYPRMSFSETDAFTGYILCYAGKRTVHQEMYREFNGHSGTNWL